GGARDARREGDGQRVEEDSRRRRRREPREQGREGTGGGRPAPDGGRPPRAPRRRFLGDGRGRRERLREPILRRARPERGDGRAVMRSARDRPEPSTIRTPVSGTPASRRVSVTTAAPAADVPPAPTSAPSAFRISSAKKLSLARSIAVSTTGSGSE